VPNRSVHMHIDHRLRDSLPETGRLDGHSASILNCAQYYLGIASVRDWFPGGMSVAVCDEGG
jgi:hypothetical protein